jgi:hypothetical protein
MPAHGLGQQVGAERRPAVDDVDAGGGGERGEPCLHAGHEPNGAFGDLRLLVAGAAKQATSGKHPGQPGQVVNG